MKLYELMPFCVQADNVSELNSSSSIQPQSILTLGSDQWKNIKTEKLKVIYTHRALESSKRVPAKKKKELFVQKSPVSLNVSVHNYEKPL